MPSDTFSLLVFASLTVQVLAVPQSLDSTSVSESLKHKRQVGDDLCYIPEPLANGLYSTHPRRCPLGDNSAACLLKPGVPVNVGWVILYRCQPGYRLNTTRMASACLQRPGGAKWLPPLPSCPESVYNSPFLPTMNVCGKSSDHRTKSRVNGKISSRGEWPWMVIFGHSRTANPADGIHWFCAGTLITTRHIITAANCVADYRRRPSVFIARLDDINLDDSDQMQLTEVTIEKKNIIIHPGFRSYLPFTDNIALVKLSFDLEITNFIRPICLPTPDFKERNLTGESVYLASWGQTDTGNPKGKGRFEPILHEIRGRVTEQEKCKVDYSNYQTTQTPYIIDDRIICAKVDVNDSCQGDVGSPLMMKYGDNYFLLGVVATQYGCFGDYPRLFTKLSLHMTWIVSNVNF